MSNLCVAIRGIDDFAVGDEWYIKFSVVIGGLGGGGCLVMMCLRCSWL
jgi:hypothetical protein